MGAFFVGKNREGDSNGQVVNEAPVEPQNLP